MKNFRIIFKNLLICLIIIASLTAAQTNVRTVTLHFDRPHIIPNLVPRRTKIILHPGVPYRNGIFTAIDVYPQNPARRQQLMAQSGGLSYVQPVWINPYGRVTFRGDPIDIPSMFNEPRYLDNPEPLHLPRCFPIPLVRSPYDETCPLVLLFPHELYCLDQFLHVTKKQRLPLQALDGTVLDEQILIAGLGPHQNLLHLWDIGEKKILKSQFPVTDLLKTFTTLKKTNDSYAALNLKPIREFLQRPQTLIKKRLQRIQKQYERDRDHVNATEIATLRVTMKYNRLGVLHPAFLQMKVMTRDRRVYLSFVYPVSMIEWDWNAGRMKSFVPAEALPNVMMLPTEGNFHLIEFALYRGEPTLWFLFTHPLTLKELKLLDLELAQRLMNENPHLSDDDPVSFDTRLWGLGFTQDGFDTVYRIPDFTRKAKPGEESLLDGLFIYNEALYMVYKNKRTGLQGYYILRD